MSWSNFCPIFVINQSVFWRNVVFIQLNTVDNCWCVSFSSQNKLKLCPDMEVEDLEMKQQNVSVSSHKGCSWMIQPLTDTCTSPLRSNWNSPWLWQAVDVHVLSTKTRNVTVWKRTRPRALLQNPSLTKNETESEDVPFVEFMYLVFTRMPGES